MVRNPLVGFDSSGCAVEILSCDEPDRKPFTEFYAGLMVLDFPVRWRETFSAMMQRRDKPLEELLEEIVLPTSETTCTVIISGMEYSPLRLTAQSEIVKI